MAADLRRPWERRVRPRQPLTPYRVRRSFRHLRDRPGTPAHLPKTTHPGPGRPPGGKNTPSPASPPRIRTSQNGRIQEGGRREERSNLKLPPCHPGERPVLRWRRAVELPVDVKELRHMTSAELSQPPPVLSNMRLPRSHHRHGVHQPAARPPPDLAPVSHANEEKRAAGQLVVLQAGRFGGCYACDDSPEPLREQVRRRIPLARFSKPRTRSRAPASGDFDQHPADLSGSGVLDPVFRSSTLPGKAPTSTSRRAPGRVRPAVYASSRPGPCVLGLRMPRPGGEKTPGRLGLLPVPSPDLPPVLQCRDFGAGDTRLSPRRRSSQQFSSPLQREPGGVSQIDMRLLPSRIASERGHFAPEGCGQLLQSAALQACACPPRRRRCRRRLKNRASLTEDHPGRDPRSRGQCRTRKP
jgi:hypothetical protein